jgi:hypothetical protein
MARSWLALTPGVLACVASLSGCELLFPVDQFMDGDGGSMSGIRDAGGPNTETDDSPMDLAAHDGSDGEGALDAAGAPNDASGSGSSGTSGGDSSGDHGGDSGGEYDAGDGGHGSSSGSDGGEGGDGSSRVAPPPADAGVPDDDAATCQKATDCTGTLSPDCIVCAGGATACSHWECQSGMCVATTVCPALPDAGSVSCGTGVCPPGDRCCTCGGTCVSAGAVCPYDSNPAIVCEGANP